MGSYYWENVQFNQLSIQFRNIQNKYRRIKNINSFINSGLQRKQRKFAENPISGSRVPHLGSRVSGPTYGLGPGFRILSPTFRVPGLGFRIPPTVPGLLKSILQKIQKNTEFNSVGIRIWNVLDMGIYGVLALYFHIKIIYMNLLSN